MIVGKSVTIGKQGRSKSVSHVLDCPKQLVGIEVVHQQTISGDLVKSGLGLISHDCRWPGEAWDLTHRFVSRVPHRPSSRYFPAEQPFSPLNPLSESRNKICNRKKWPQTPQGPCLFLLASSCMKFPANAESMLSPDRAVIKELVPTDGTSDSCS